MRTYIPEEKREYEKMYEATAGKVNYKMPIEFKKPKIELKPCPFCGNKDVEIHDVWDTISGKSYRGKTVLCNFDKGGCGAECGTRITEAEAIEAWNRRVE